MAKKVIALQVELTAGQAATELDELNKKAEATGESITGVSESFVPLKKQLKEAVLAAQELSAKFGENSKQAIEAQKKVANLKESISDLNARIESLNPEAKFKALAQVASSVAGGFAAAQGAMALFGGESEELQKQMLKVQAAMAFAQGINELRGLGDAFKNLKVVVLDFFKVIAANPLTAFLTAVAAVGTAIAAWLTSESELEEQIKKSREAEEKRFEISQASYENQIKLAKALGKETKALEEAQTADMIDNIKIRIDLREKEYKAEVARIRNLAKMYGKKVQDDLAAEVEGADEIRKLKLQLESLETDLTAKRFNDLDVVVKETAKAVDKQIDLDKKRHDAGIKAAEDAKKKYLELNDEILLNEERTRLARSKALEEEMEFIRFTNEFSSTANQITTDNAMSTLDVMKQIADQTVFSFREKTEILTKDITDFLNSNQHKLIEFGTDTIQTGLNTVSNFMNAAMATQLKATEGNEKQQESIRKKFFERQKKVQIAQALMSTYEGAVNAFKSTASNPITAVFPAAPYIAAASAIALGISNIRQIQAQQYQGGSTGGGASGGGSGVPNLNVSGGGSPSFGSTQLPREQIEGGQQVVIENTISETEITRKQKRANMIKTRSEID